MKLSHRIVGRHNIMSTRNRAHALCLVHPPHDEARAVRIRLSLNTGCACGGLIFASGSTESRRAHDGALGLINSATTLTMSEAYSRKVRRKLDNGNKTRSDQQDSRSSARPARHSLSHTVPVLVKPFSNVPRVGTMSSGELQKSTLCRLPPDSCGGVGPFLASGGTELPSREQPCSASEHVRNQCGKYGEESIGLASDEAHNDHLVAVVRRVTRDGEDRPDAARHSLCTCLCLASAFTLVSSSTESRRAAMHGPNPATVKTVQVKVGGPTLNGSRKAMAEIGPNMRKPSVNPNPTIQVESLSRFSARPAYHPLYAFHFKTGVNNTNMTPRKTECECGRPLTWRPNNRGGCDYCTRLEKEGYDQYIKPRSVTNRFGEAVNVLDAYAFRGQTTGMINML